RILFNGSDNPFYDFSNSSPHPVRYEGKTYPTSEHLFQSFKFLDDKPNIAEYIKTCSRYPRDICNEADRYHNQIRPDWLHVQINVMDIVLSFKFNQHEDLKRELLSTGDAELIQDS
ncbi:hypothetical protein SERLA73DRAFT_14892, partial [Serpula lacrymans var. lacrymans S7.3]